MQLSLEELKFENICVRSQFCNEVIEPTYTLSYTTCLCIKGWEANQIKHVEEYNPNNGLPWNHFDKDTVI